MIFSVFVYLTLLVSLVFCGRYQNYRIKFFDNPIPSTGILLILIYTLVVGKHSASCVFFSPLFLPTFVASL